MIAHPIALGLAVFLSLGVLAPDNPDARWADRMGRILAILVAAISATIAVWSPL